METAQRQNKTNDFINYDGSETWWGQYNTTDILFDESAYIINDMGIREFSVQYIIEPYLSHTTYTNVISSNYTNESTCSPYITGDSYVLNQEDFTSISENSALNYLPLFFGKADLVKIPSKVKYSIKQIPTKTLKQVHSDKDVAYEFCLIFLSQLTSTYFEVKSGSNLEGWKSLNSKYLMELIGIDSTCYKRIRNVLEYPLENGSILECDYKYITGQKNYYYRIGSWYLDKGVHAYKLQTDIAKKQLYKNHLGAFARASENVICRNLFHFYSQIEIPAIQEIEKEATNLIKEGFKNKKGKTLIRRNKHSNSHFKNFEKLTFVEDAIEIYNYLTNEKGIMIPTIGGETSGGRIVDSFTLMPSWIRNMITINGERLVECDYICLHPNIAISIYGGSSKYITHKQLAIYLKLDELAVKKEHLSFFNKPVNQMMQSPLWNYYLEKEPQILENIIQDKLYNTIEPTKDKHKITSRILFKKEVSIMTEAIGKLNAEGIYVMYVYDALYCLPAHKNRVQEVMNEVVLNQGVFTKVKV